MLQFKYPLPDGSTVVTIYNETSIHRFRWGSGKKNNGSGKTIDAGAIVEIGYTQGP
jgi:hypothetical protein